MFPKRFRWCDLRDQGWSRQRHSTGSSTWPFSIISKHYSAGLKKSRYPAGLAGLWLFISCPGQLANALLLIRTGSDRRLSLFGNKVPTRKGEELRKGHRAALWPGSLGMSHAGRGGLSQAHMARLERNALKFPACSSLIQAIFILSPSRK